MHPYVHATNTPDHPAIIMASTDEVVTYQQLNSYSNQIAQLARARGLGVGDSIAIFMDNSKHFLEICWAAQRAGLYFTAISSRLTAPEVEYIIKDCGAKLLFTSDYVKHEAVKLPNLLPDMAGLFMTGETADGFESYVAARDAQTSAPIDDETRGMDMLYSSGTTGRPKGIRRALTGQTIDDNDQLLGLVSLLYGFDQNTIYLSPAPLYHAAPLRYNMAVQHLGGTCVIMENFDPEQALALIEKHKCNKSQWVPTMFIRMLKLPDEARTKYDISSMQTAIHAAAPCPIPIKEQMIDWWGPVIHEYYAGSEGNGFTQLNAEEWLSHKGSVGKALSGILHICDDDGNELPTGQSGTVYFEQPEETPSFEYHNAPKKTADSRHPVHKNWSTLGDVGRVDEEGYLYLTDRKAFMIITGGVNVYPQETENLLITHPKVADVAVFGVPNEDFGEEVKAVVQPANWAEAGPELEEQLIAYCKENLSSIKCPRSVDFDKELPRHPTGKLYKRLVRDRYWGNSDSKIV